MKRILAPFLSLALVSASFGTITSPQFLHVYSGGASNHGTFTTSVTTGDIIVVFVSGTSTGGFTCSDSQSNAYINIQSGTNQPSCTSFYTYNASGGSCTMTLSGISGESDLGFTAIEYHSSNGNFTSDPIDKHGQARGLSGVTSISVSFTTVGANDVLVCGQSDETSYSFTGWTANLTQVQLDTGHIDGQAQGLNKPAAAYTEGITGVTSGSSNQNTVILLAFKEPVGTPPIVNNFLFFFSLIFAPYGLRPTPEPLIA